MVQLWRSFEKKNTRGIKAGKTASLEKQYNSEGSLPQGNPLLNSLPKTIDLPDEQLGRSLGAKWANADIRMPDGGIAHFVEGSKLHHVQVFAGKGTKIEIRNVDYLANVYGGDENDWQKVKAIGTILYDGEEFDAEVHWYRNQEFGIQEEWKYKRMYENKDKR